MQKQTLGQKIAELRKAKNMTQLELANRLNITDKAVSKWERDISCPDINTFPKLAEILGVSVDELLQASAAEKEETSESKLNIKWCSKRSPLHSASESPCSRPLTKYIGRTRFPCWGSLFLLFP